MPTKITILGDGAMGIACALLLAQKPNMHVTLWSAREANGKILQERRENVRLLPGVPIPPSIELTMDPQAAVSDAELLVVAIPTVYLRDTLARVAKNSQLDPQLAAVSVTKGLELETFLRPSEIIRQVLGDRPVVALSGPSHAEEISRGMPASVVVASTDAWLADEVQSLFSTNRFRVYTNADIVGVELSAALKNIMGVAAGICDGLGFGDNAKSALLTRGLAEMTRFGVAHGAERGTFMGLAGIGDLITTCVSPHGRNRRVGEMIGKGKRLREVLGEMQQVAEGVYTARSVHDKAAVLGLDMPITAEVYRMLYMDKDPRSAVQDLMSRELKSEG